MSVNGDAVLLSTLDKRRKSVTSRAQHDFAVSEATTFVFSDGFII